eukprot:TRINITY_DN18910_c0_g1_i2.p2 TRINITY_DN18910_c0_g1~~TRINITY_DN18910_c0_g1_i2.p2  ORF type:complete len:107 (+),score=4.86 TRINITY_DN18910_c0_g1_i2:474-794(+)
MVPHTFGYCAFLSGCAISNAGELKLVVALLDYKASVTALHEQLDSFYRPLIRHVNLHPDFFSERAGVREVLRERRDLKGASNTQTVLAAYPGRGNLTEHRLDTTKD